MMLCPSRLPRSGAQAARATSWHRAEEAAVGPLSLPEFAITAISYKKVTAGSGAA